MAGRGFETARRTGSTVPRVIGYHYKDGQTFTDRALVFVDDADGSELKECSANPAIVMGVALNGVASTPGWDLPNSTRTNVVTGRVQVVSVALADAEQEFSCRGVNGGTDPVTPTQANIGLQYGVLKVGTEWVLNLADTINVVCEVTGIRLDDNVFLVKFLKAVRQSDQ